MMNLYIDTSSSDVSIAILKDDKLLSKVINNIPNKHSVYTVSYIKEALKNANVDKNKIDNIFIVNGPGSFTGIRIGLTIAKIYSYLLKINIFAVSSLKSYALSANSNIILSIMKANSKNYYIGLYDYKYNEIIKEHFTSLQEIECIIEKYNPLIVSNDNLIINEKKVNKISLNFEKIVSYYIKTKPYTSFDINPNYLKLPQALENKNDK